MAIKPKKKVKVVAVTTRYPEPVITELDQFVEYLRERAEDAESRDETDRNYVIGELVKNGLAGDKEFQRWARARTSGTKVPAGAGVEEGEKGKAA